MELEQIKRKAFVLQPHLGDELKLMTDLGFEITNDVKEASVVVFTGGEDVDPSLYNEDKMPLTSSNPKRDEREWELLDGLDGRVIKIGICRGAQFLCAFYGGKLWQHVDRHGVAEIGHPVLIVGKPWATEIGAEVVHLNSYHHQALRILPSSWELVGVTNVSKNKVSQSVSACDHRDVEIAVSTKDRVLAFQPHPEFRDNETRTVFKAMVSKFVRDIDEIDNKVEKK